MATTVTATADHMRRMLSPHRGRWVAVEHGWRRVLAAHEDREACLALACARQRSESTTGASPAVARDDGATGAAAGSADQGLPLLYRVPDAPAAGVAASAA